MPPAAHLKAQAATEYLMLIGILLMLAIPLWLYMNSAMASTGAELRTTYAENSVSEIVRAADMVYVQGAPAKATVYVKFPENVESVTISGKTLLMVLSVESGTTDVYETSLANLTGSLSTHAGMHKVSVSAVDSSVNITEG
ncbi:MAG: hypothetical protein AB1468_03780 [Candidatus Micrarchaeota archaeon]